MPDVNRTYRREVLVANPLGFNMRLSDLFMKAAGSFQSEILVEHGSARANGKSILELCALAAECGVTIRIEARGPDAEEAVAALGQIVGT